MYTCSICGGKEFDVQNALSAQLISDWQLSSLEAAYVNQQQGCYCKICGANLRIIALGYAVNAYFNSDTPLRMSVKKPAISETRVLDLNGAISISEILCKLPGYVRGDYPQVDMHRLPYADNSFDLVLHSDTLEHIAQPVRGLEECRRVLNATGRLCFTVPLIVGRMTRNRSGLRRSFHGDPNVGADDFLVHTEFGADTWCFVMQAGFTYLTINQVHFPVATAFTAFTNPRL